MTWARLDVGGHTFVIIRWHSRKYWLTTLNAHMKKARWSSPLQSCLCQVHERLSCSILPGGWLAASGCCPLHHYDVRCFLTTYLAAICDTFSYLQLVLDSTGYRGSDASAHLVRDRPSSCFRAPPRPLERTVVLTAKRRQASLQPWTRCGSSHGALEGMDG